jgi:hypothetical protein
MAMNTNHKQQMLAALDHLDGILGDTMQQAHDHVANVKGSMSDGDDPQEGAEKYAGQDNAGGHAGHPFSSKNQHGEQNDHFGHFKSGGDPGAGDSGGSENPNFPRKKSMMGLLGG